MSLEIPKKKAYSNHKLLLVDGDIIAWSCSAVCEGHHWIAPDGKEFRYKKEAVQYCFDNGIMYGAITDGYRPEPVANCLHSIRELINTMFEQLDSDNHIIYLSSTTSFRKVAYPDYKANRDGVKKPTHYQAAIDYLMKNYNTIVADDSFEADDMLGFHSLMNPDSIICSLDKDLDQITGYHYNWRKQLLYYVNSQEAMSNLYKQFLVGDTVDNIQGVKGIGPKKAEKIIGACEDEQEMRDCILYLYDGDNEWFEKNELLLSVGGNLRLSEVPF